MIRKHPGPGVRPGRHRRVPGGTGRPMGQRLEYLRRSGFFITGSILLTILVLMALAPQLFTFGKDPRACDLYQARKGISAAHWLGTDLQGCDYYANVVYGARVSLTIGLIAMVGVLIIGVIVGRWPDTSEASPIPRSPG